MISVENHIPVKKEFGDAFEARFREGTRHVQNAPGFLRNEVLRPIQGDHYIVRTYWDSMESFERWAKSDPFKQAHATPPSADIFAGKSFITIHEVVAQTVAP